MKTFSDSFNNYLLLTVTLCFASGIACSYYFPVQPLQISVIALINCITVYIFRLILPYRATVAIVCILFFCAGYLAGTRERQHVPDISHISHVITEKKEMIIVGILAKMVTGNKRSQKAIVETTFYRTEETPYFSQVTGTVLLTLKGEWPQAILPGSSVAIRAVLKKPSTRNTPGTFDYKRFLAHKDIYVVGTISSPLLIQAVANQSAETSRHLYLTERIRTHIANFINKSLPAESAGLYRAVLLGDRSTIAPAVLDSFKGAGAMHILAISGMHMALLGFFLFISIFWILRRSEQLILATSVRKLSMLLCIPLLLLYTMLAGAQAPVVRSLIMSLFVIAAFSTDRMRSPITILAGAGLVMLMLNPTALEGASFQLSFAAVAAILIITPRITQLLPIQSADNTRSLFSKRILRWLFTAIAVTISATIGTAPLLLYHFNRLSTVTIPANLVVEPLICLWSLPCGFLAIPFMFFFPPLAELILQTGAPGLVISVKVTSFLTNMPFSTLWLPDPPPAAIALYYISLILLLTVPISSLLLKPAKTGFVVSLIIFIFPLTPVSGYFRGGNTVSFIDIGHGSSGLIELSTGRTVLVDGGSISAPGFDCGERIIAPFLWNRGIGRLDDIILTHADADHYNGIPAIIERFRPKRLWVPHFENSKPGYNRLCRIAKDHHVEMIVPDSGIFISEGNSNLEIIGQAANILNIGQDENDLGLIIRLNTPDFSVIFPGDISTKKELELVEIQKFLKADILLSPHHGSSTSNSRIFLSTVQPDYLIVSAGNPRNKLFPATTTQENAEELGITMLTTLQNGTIYVQGNGKGYSINTFRFSDE